MTIPSADKLYAEVIGDPIAQSKSPLIHGFWLEKCGLDAAYDKTRVAPDGLADYLTERKADKNWRGCNVTMPHKQAIVPLLDQLTPLAQRIGAVNTVIRQEDGSLLGHNTDVGGFLEPLQDHLSQDHLFRMARILGTGGAAKALVTGLSDQGMVIVLAGRNVQKAAAMLEEQARGDDHHSVALSHFSGPTDFAFDDREGCLDVIVNASPLGMRGQPDLAFDFSHAPPGSIVYDIVTDPVETRFLQDAKAAGFETIDGLAMLIGQAAEAFTLFFDQPPPRGFDTDLRKRLME